MYHSSQFFEVFSLLTSPIEVGNFRKSEALINSHRLKKPKDDQTDANFIEFPRTHLQSCFLNNSLKDILKWFE